VVHLRPLGRRFDRHPDPVQIYADSLPIGFAGRLDLQRLLEPVSQSGSVGGDRVVVECLDLDRALALSQVVTNQPGFRVLTSRVTCLLALRLLGEDQASAPDPAMGR
jgi:hypothetical protein